MESWVWWLIWGFLGLLALGTWIILLASFKRPIMKIVGYLLPLAEQAQKLQEAGERKTKAAHPKDNLRDDPNDQVLKRKEFLDLRRKRKEARARRLVARVKNIKVEGRLKDVR